ncbi:MAG TPA: hypothetical protein VLC52_15090 [Anaerolineae bacterium]|nr:hypothetical protein [Anaerolineae bacterium]
MVAGGFLGRVGDAWRQGKGFRVALLLALGVVVLRLAAQVLLSTGVLTTGQFGQEVFFPPDLQDYWNAARHIQAGEDLYLAGALDRVEFYQYTPSFALAFSAFLVLSPMALVLTHTVLHLAAYVGLWFSWDRIFRRLGLEQARRALVYTLPAWLVFSGFWSDLVFLNTYIIMALLATQLIDAVLHERLGWSLVWLSIILQIKPQWAFAAALPLLLGRPRFFVRLVGLAIAAYAGVVALTCLAVGPAYGLEQHADYFSFLWNMRQNFPWRGAEAPFLGYNHSIAQIVTYLLGVSPGTLRLALAIKALLLVPLAVLGLRHVLNPVGHAGREVPRLALDLTFALYLAAFVWLDMVWELSLGVALFTYVLATEERRQARPLIWAAFLCYALQDLGRLLSVALLGPGIMTANGYVLSDPAIYLPLNMMVILFFYGLLIYRLRAGRLPLPAAGSVGP